MKLAFASALTASALIFAGVLHADDTPTFDIIIKDHKFAPATLEIPANKKVKLIVKNQRRKNSSPTSSTAKKSSPAIHKRSSSLAHLTPAPIRSSANSTKRRRKAK